MDYRIFNVRTDVNANVDVKGLFSIQNKQQKQNKTKLINNHDSNNNNNQALYLDRNGSKRCRHLAVYLDSHSQYTKIR